MVFKSWYVYQASAKKMSNMDNKKKSKVKIKK